MHGGGVAVGPAGALWRGGGGPAPFPQGPADDLLITPYVVTETCYLVSKYGGGAAEINLVEDDACGHIDGVMIGYPAWTTW